MQQMSDQTEQVIAAVTARVPVGFLESISSAFFGLNGRRKNKELPLAVSLGSSERQHLIAVLSDFPPLRTFVFSTIQ